MMDGKKRFSLALAAALLGMGAGTDAVAEDGYYLGISAVAALYDATYDKTVDNTAATNASMLFAGERLAARDSADQLTYDVGLLVGYRGSFGVLFYSIEGDLTVHRGELSSRFEGVGTTPRRNQVGENWPEDWSLAKDRSYGLTLRVGGKVPILDTSGYVLVGVRRVETDFERSYTGCFLTRLCEPQEFGTGVEFFDENFNAFATGVGIEQPFGPATLRAELRYVFHGEATQLALFDDLGVRVPTSLDASEIGLGAALLWTF